MIAQEIINNNGISAIAAAFFTGLFGFLGLIFSEGRKEKRQIMEKLEDVKDFQQIILQKHTELETAFRDHLNWHAQQERGNNGNPSHPSQRRRR